MRIAHVVSRAEQPWSGVLTVIAHLSAALSRQGQQVEVWRLHEWGPSYAEHRRTMGEAGVTQLRVAMDDPWWRVGRAVAGRAEQRKIEVVHLHGAFNVWNALISRALRRPYVFSPHSGYDPISLRRSRGRKALYGVLLEHRMLDRAALIVALTEVERGQVESYGALPPVTVIPNGVAPAAGDVDGRPFRRELGIGSGWPLALFVGRLDVQRKGLDVLVRGIARAPNWHLALVGPRFRGVSDLEDLTGRLRVSERVHFAGERHGQRLREALAAADVFTLLSRWEGLPMALLEGLSFGKPAIVSSAVDRLVGVEAAGAGWVADENSLPAMLYRFAAAQPEELQRHQEAARLLAKRYDWDEVAGQYGMAYERAWGRTQMLTD